RVAIGHPDVPDRLRVNRETLPYACSCEYAHRPVRDCRRPAVEAGVEHGGRRLAIDDRNRQPCLRQRRREAAADHAGADDDDVEAAARLRARSLIRHLVRLLGCGRNSMALAPSVEAGPAEARRRAAAAAQSSCTCLISVLLPISTSRTSAPPPSRTERRSAPAVGMVLE